MTLNLSGPDHQPPEANPDPPPERLLRVARDLFYTRGYRSVGVRELCEAAGVQRGTFYHYFSSKEELLLLVVDDWIAEVRQVFEVALVPDVPPRERLRRLFRHTRDFNASIGLRTGRVQGCPLLVLASGVGTTVEGVRRRIEEAYSALASALERTLSDGMGPHGQPPRNVKMAAEAILAYHQGSTLLARVADDPDVVARLGEGALRLALGIGEEEDI